MKNKPANAQSLVPTTDAPPAAGTVKLVGDSFAVMFAPGQGMTIRAQIPCRNGT